jgi:hypothetical protein
VEPKGTPPASRFGYVSVVHENKFILFGGYDGVTWYAVHTKQTNRGGGGGHTRIYYVFVSLACLLQANMSICMFDMFFFFSFSLNHRWFLG